MSVGSVTPSREPDHAPIAPLRDGISSGSFESSLMDILDAGASLEEDHKVQQERRSKRDDRSGEESSSAREQRSEERRSEEEREGVVNEEYRVDEEQSANENATDATAESIPRAEDSVESSLAADTQALDIEANPSVTDELLEQILERTREYLSSPESDAGAEDGSDRPSQDGGQSGARIRPAPVESQNIEPEAPRPVDPEAQQAEAETLRDSRPMEPETRREVVDAQNPQQTGEQRLEDSAVVDSRRGQVQPDSPARSANGEPGELREVKAGQVVDSSAEPRSNSRSGSDSDSGRDRGNTPEREAPSVRDADLGPRSTTAAAATAERLVESERSRSLAAATTSVETTMEPSIAQAATNTSALPIEVAVEVPAEVAAPSAPESAPRAMPPEAIPQHIEWLVARGGGSAEIQLHPPELGKLSIQVIVRGGDVQVVMHVHEGSAQTVVAEYRESLENSLAAKDLKLDQFEVRDGSNRGDSSSRDDQGHADSERNGGSEGRGGQGALRGVASALVRPDRGNDAVSGDDRINLRV